MQLQRELSEFNVPFSKKINASKNRQKKWISKIAQAFKNQFHFFFSDRTALSSPSVNFENDKRNEKTMWMRAYDSQSKSYFRSKDIHK